MPARAKEKTTSAKWTKEKIRDAYIKTLLLEGKQPNSVFKFTDDLGMPESEFYTFYSSFDAIENDVLTNASLRPLSKCQAAVAATRRAATKKAASAMWNKR